MTQIYVHQAEAYARARAGRDWVVATPTASGKSLCYNLPILETLETQPEARALYLFPTKALSRDQEDGLRGLMKAAGLRQGAITYDGDTPGDVRRAARERSGVLVTNPDMLHSGILPHHAQWARFFANLEYIVVDEVHAYRGVFGSHLSNVLRRLERVAAFHGARPQIFFSSATIANPGEHASRLAGRPVSVIDENGAPAADRQVLVYNPPLVNAELGMRRSYVKCAVDRTLDLLRAEVSTLVFGQSRNTVEVMLKYLRDRMPATERPNERIQGYRGGYLPETRRRIERGLREGDIDCVVATNALELGVDIGALDAVVCAGYPGSMSGLWQRFGRGGRRGDRSLALLIPSSSPLDQFLAVQPELLMSAPIEAARIDPDNVEILVQHLKCAAFELQFRTGEGAGPADAFGDLPADALSDALGFLESHGVVRSVPSRGGGTVHHWSAEAHPASHISLRSPSFDNFVIVNVETEKTIAEMDFRSTHTMLHEQAIYQHDGLQFQVERLDYENHKAFVRKVAPDYYTTAMTHVRVSVLEEERSEPLGFEGAPELSVGWGEVDVVEKVVGFKKIKFHTHENVGYGEVTLPAVEKPTTAFWIMVPESVLAEVEAPRAVVMDALRGWLNALEGVAAVGLMMDGRDLGTAFVDEPGVGATPSSAPALPKAAGPAAEGEEEPESASMRALVDDLGLEPEPSKALRPLGAIGIPVGLPPSGAFEPILYLYDAVAGGVGLAPRLWEERRSLLERSAELIGGCGCEAGCPSCVGPVVGVFDGFSRKQVALQVLSALGLHEARP